MTDQPSPLVRFAPSPTGLLHVGNVRAALINWLFARRSGGRFMLRIDDTDTVRSRPEYEQAIRRDLRWLGLDWDLEARQSDRMAFYEAARDKLIAAGRLYPCYETPEELELKRKARLSAGMPPVYDRAALKLTDADRTKLEAEGRAPHWRFLLTHEDVVFTDHIRGETRLHGGDYSDPVLIRGDGLFLYTLCSVVDDIDFGITHVIRGEDHVANTAVQIQLFRALGAVEPGFAHYPLLSDLSGDKLSKRSGSLSVEELRDELGVEPMAIASLLAKIGTSDAIEPRLTLADLAAELDFSHFSRGAPKFDPAELERLNARILHDTPYEAVRERLAPFGEANEAFWLAVRPNLVRFADVAAWAAVAHGPVTPLIDEPDFITEAAGLLPLEPWDATSWKSWTGAVSAATGRKGKQLFLPLRRALTGLDHGPELAVLLPLIGRARVLERLGCSA